MSRDEDTLHKFLIRSGADGLMVEHPDHSYEYFEQMGNYSTFNLEGRMLPGRTNNLEFIDLNSDALQTSLADRKLKYCYSTEKVFGFDN